MKLFFICFLFTFFLSSLLITSLKNKNRSIASSSNPSISDLVPDQQFLTISNTRNKQNIITHEPGKDSEYIQRVFGILIQSASAVSKQDIYFPENSNFQNYYHFLFANLVIAEFESKLVHLTLRETAEYCSLPNNILSPVYDFDRPLIYYPKKLSDIKSQIPLADDSVRSELENQALMIEKKIEKSQNINENIPKILSLTSINKQKNVLNCANQKSRKELQLQLSSDYRKIGPMMIDPVKHQDFFSSNSIYDLPKLISYSSQYLYQLSKRSGDSVSLNSQCFEEFEDPKHRVIFEKIVKILMLKNIGAMPLNVCSRPEIKVLREVFDRLIEQDHQFSSIYHLYLPRDSVERKAFFEIINNVKNNKDDSQSLNRLYNNDYVGVEFIDEEKKMSRLLVVLEDEEEVKVVLSDEQTEQTKLIDSKSSASQIHNNDLLRISDDETQSFLPSIATMEFTSKEQDYILIGHKTNLRSSPLLLNDNYCGNTRYLEFKPIKVIVSKFIESEGFYKINLNEVSEAVHVNKCKDDKYIYVYKSFIRKTEPELDYKRGVLDSWVTLRKKPGVKASTIIGVQGPGQIIITNEVLKNDKYLWVELLDVNGDRAWFYAGQTGDFKLDYIK
jgi:hypothetical protein